MRLFSEEPLKLKRRIYENRCDEVRADYALFGPYLVGLRVPSEELDALMRGHVRGSTRDLRT